MKFFRRVPLYSLLIVALFVLTRAYIWFNKPMDFTEIVYSYMPYAHLWASGVKPYLEQWYEYPPVTIPLFYAPHLVDMASRTWPIHVDYGQAYRGILLIVDTLLFALVWRSLHKFKTKASVKYLALVYYSLVTAKANHFLYDTMDWTFAAAMTLSVAPLLTGWANSLQRWVGYWAAVGLKLLNGPLGLPLAILESKNWKKNWPWIAIAGGLVWGLPVLLYRSSLQVMLVFHQIRGLQVDSFTAIIVRFMDSFYHSEKVIEVYKNYETTGPLTTTALQILDVAFPVALIAFIGWTTWQAWKLRSTEKKHELFRLSITLGYVLLLMITSKVLSRPFVLWHVPLLAIVPFKNIREQMRFLIPSALLIAVTLSPIPDFPVGPFRTALFVGMIRSFSFLFLLWEWYRWHKKNLL